MEKSSIQDPIVAPERRAETPTGVDNLNRIIHDAAGAMAMSRTVGPYDPAGAEKHRAEAVRLAKQAGEIAYRIDEGPRARQNSHVPAMLKMSPELATAYSAGRESAKQLSPSHERDAAGGAQHRSGPTADKVQEELAWAKEARKNAEMLTMRQQRQAVAQGWTVDEAKLQAQRDVSEYADLTSAGERGAGEARYLRDDMAMRGAANRAYDTALKEAAPQLHDLVHTGSKEAVAVDAAAASQKAPNSARSLEAPARAESAPPPETPTPAPEVAPRGNAIEQSAPATREQATTKSATAINSIEPEPKQERRMESLEAADWRTTAKAALGDKDPEADVKRHLIDRATDDEGAKLRTAGTAPEKLTQAYVAIADRLVHEHSSNQSRAPYPPLEDRFKVIPSGQLTRQYEFTEQPGKVAFEDRLISLRTTLDTPVVVGAIADRAAERGWDNVRVTGSEDFKRQAWVALEARGVHATGYEPTQADAQAVKVERARLDAQERAQPAAAARNSSQQVAGAAGTPQGDQKTAQTAAKPAVTTDQAFGQALEAAMAREEVPEKLKEALRQGMAKQLDVVRAVGSRAVLKTQIQQPTPAMATAQPRKTSPDRHAHDIGR